MWRYSGHGHAVIARRGDRTGGGICGMLEIGTGVSVHAANYGAVD